MADTPRTRIGVFVFEGAEELDFVGPWEVLTMWSKSFPDDRVDVFTVADALGPVRCAKGLQVIPDHTWETAPPIDVLVYPGGEGMRPHVQDETIHKRLHGLRDGGATIASVCTGSLVLAAAGLLDHTPATTHWAYLDTLASLGDTIDVRRDHRFVDAGQVLTAAGVSAGIDMALHLVARLHSTERAREVKRFIQYDPQPPV